MRDPRTGAVYPAGARDSDDGVCREGVVAAAGHHLAGDTNNYTILQQFTNHTDKAGGKIDMRLNDRATIFGRYGWRDLNTVDQPPIPLTGRRRRQRHDLREEQAARARCDLRAGQRVAPGSHGSGGPRPAQGKTRRRSGRAARSTSTASAGLPVDARIAGGLPTQQITGYSRSRPTAYQPAVAVSDGVQSEGELHDADRPSLD